jgi:TolB-like protein/Flp pilus assembly protein TadD
MAFLQELRRRKVFRLAALYIVGAWVVLQVADLAFESWDIASSALRYVWLGAILGFPIALIFGWRYDITTKGIVRTPPTDVDTQLDLSLHRGDYVILSLLLVMAIGVIYPLMLQISDSRAPGLAKYTQEEIKSNSIAVLPFANRSANPEDAYFVDGIHDDLLTHISKISAIRTISRTSVMQYRESSKTIPEIAAELGVATVLEGGVQRAGDQIRINVQLIDARTDEHLWAEIYDRQLLATNIFAIQSEIAEAIAETLRMTLSPREQQRNRSVPTESFAAYEAYLIGKQSMEKRTPESLAGAEEFFRQAVELDPRYALAWVGLADTYIFQISYSGLPERENLGKAKAAIDMALELDRGLGEAYASLGLLKGHMNDLEGAEQAYKQALELSPNYAMGHRWYSGLLARLGRWEERLVSMETAIRLDPLSNNIRYNYANALREIGRSEEALEQLEILLEISPRHARAHQFMAAIQWHDLNRLDMAAQGYVKLINLDTNEPVWYEWLAQLYLDLGEPERASLLLDRAKELASDPNKPVFLMLLLHLYQQRDEGIAEDAKAVLAISDWLLPFFWHFSAAQLRNLAMAEGRYDAALAVYSKHQPQLLLDREPVIDLNNYRDAIDLSLVLQIMGDQERASMLLERSRAFIEEQSTIPWFGGYWISNVQILALQGKKAETLAALRLAADEGWRSLWWYYLQYDPNLESIRSEPEFQTILTEFKTDMSAQMQRIREMERSGEIETVTGVIFESF